MNGVEEVWIRSHPFFNSFSPKILNI
jgi:hypothetical protein